MYRVPGSKGGLQREAGSGAEAQRTGQEAGRTEARIRQASQGPRTMGSHDRVSSKGMEGTDRLLVETT